MKTLKNNIYCVKVHFKKNYQSIQQWDVNFVHVLWYNKINNARRNVWNL